jgi:hypothetical protein
MECWIDGLDLAVRGYCRDAGEYLFPFLLFSARSFLMPIATSRNGHLLSSEHETVNLARTALTHPNRIVEYATRDQAQNAVNTLSNQQLMGRLVYVREVRLSCAAAAYCCLSFFSSHFSLFEPQTHLT